jgi:hypothetical protein
MMQAHKVGGCRLRAHHMTLIKPGFIRTPDERNIPDWAEKMICPKRIKWAEKRKAWKFKNERTFTIVRLYYDGRKSRKLGYGPMTEEECQAHCRDPKTKKAGVYFDGYDSI